MAKLTRDWQNPNDAPVWLRRMNKTPRRDWSGVALIVTCCVIAVGAAFLIAAPSSLLLSIFL